MIDHSKHPESLYRELLESVEAIVWDADASTGRIRYINQHFERVFGYSTERCAGEPGFWQSVIHPEDRVRVVEARDTAIANREGIDIEYRAEAADGRLVWLREVVHLVCDSEGNPVQVRGFAVDVTAQKMQEWRNAAIAHSVRLMASSETLAEAAPRVLETLCYGLNWGVGELWIVDPETELISCMEVWHIPGREIPEFEASSGSQPFTKGLGLPGRVWEQDSALWVSDYAFDDSFPRAKSARKEGIVAAFSVPATVAGRVVGALCFYSFEEREQEEGIFAQMEGVGSQLGLLISRKETEEKFRESEILKRAILGAALDAVVTMDHTGAVVEFNAAAQKMFGYTEDEVVGKLIADLIVPPSLREQHLKGLRRYNETLESRVLDQRLELPAMRSDGSIFLAELTITKADLPGPPVFAGFIRDITERKRMEEDAMFQTALLESQNEATIDGILILSPQGAVRHYNQRFLGVWDASDESVQTVAKLQSMIRRRGGAEFANRFKTLTTDMENAERCDIDLVDGRVIESWTAPLLDRMGESLGRAWYFREVTEQRVAERNLETLYKERDRIAQVLQQSLIPRDIPEIPGLEVSPYYRAAGMGTEPGGDFYDLFETADGSWEIVLGDVCGKGVDAAVLTQLARYTVRTAAMQSDRPSRILGTLNQAILHQGFYERFCTIVCARIEPSQEHTLVTLACGGHPLPMVLTAKGEVFEVGAPGTVVGVFPEPELYDEIVRLNAGDTMLFFTDGIVEARGKKGIFGTRRLRSLLRTLKGMSPSEITTKIAAEAVEFQAGAPRDDIAMFAVRVMQR